MLDINKLNAVILSVVMINVDVANVVPFIVTRENNVWKKSKRTSVSKI
jgi:hypothetical protein